MLSESEIMAVFSVKSAIIGDDVKLYHLNVLLDPATGIVEDAESLDLECDIRDILDISRRLQREHSLPYLLQSAYARIRS
ncbi:hypothetical protein NQZ79_g4609 [Umbelopsis isabellina]|nr:hypothetical protein NQZ79_g4609 [Umbelopsis isabellina]